MESGTVWANGQQLYFESAGEGAPLVLIMGIGQDSSPWRAFQVPAFSNFFRTIVFDNRDSGRSSLASGPYTIADMADDLAGLMDGLNIKRSHVLGHSMGGMIAMEFAFRYPGRLEKLVLACTSAGTGRTRFDPISSWSFISRADAAGANFKAMQYAWSFSTQFSRDSQAVEELIAGEDDPSDAMPADAFDRQSEAYLAHDALDRLHQIKAETLVLAAEQDRLTPPWLGREIADAIPGASFHLIEGDGASHAVFLERPGDYNKPILEFLY